MRGNGTYVGDDIQVVFSARGVVCDYGVSRSPVWLEWDDVEIDALTICGVKVDQNTLPADLVEAIRELSDFVEFEGEERTYD